MCFPDTPTWPPNVQHPEDLPWRQYRQPPVIDHEYFGNLCTGFGGESKCMVFIAGQGQCGRPASEHLHYHARHRRDLLEPEMGEGPSYEPKHRRRVSVDLYPRGAVTAGGQHR